MAKSKTTLTQASQIPDKHLVMLKVDPDAKKTKVLIKFNEIVKSDGNGTEEEEGNEPSVIAIPHTIEGPYAPRKEFVDAMKKLRKFALERCEMEVNSETKDIADYTVLSIKISGDVTLRQSRVVMVVKKTVSTGKEIKFTTPQTTMYGESDFDNAPALAKAIEAIIEMAWNYIGGDYAEDYGTQQLPLFERITLDLSTT